MVYNQKKNDELVTTAIYGDEIAAIGLESEFTVYVDEKEAKPEDIFGTPKVFLPENSMHRVGSSYHMPTGCAVYFDSGVIEIATPVIEIEKGCAARAGRSLWEGVNYLRDELDQWEIRENKKIRLEGFSTHYSVSFDLSDEERAGGRNEKSLALLLSYILPVPVMLLIANRKSTGIGVRPRKNRIEITADFVPSPSLMIAAATLITGVVRKVMTWPSYDLEMLKKKKIPVLNDYKPTKHRSRKGWLAKDDCFSINPFTCNIDEKLWVATEYKTKQSLRAIANKIYRIFDAPVESISGPFTSKLISSVLKGKAPSLLDLAERPKEYEDVGRLCTWNNLFPEKELARSKYERVLINSILRRKLNLAGVVYTPTGMKGWEEVVFSYGSNNQATFHINKLTKYLDIWEQNG
ncbi:MAG: hypothetical protein KAG92_08865 [Deltaproteobacteria bacterium]|nr:hypothetical protein [Deltaproteobacteria bacterium]